ncbi:MAG TPA: amidase [Anaerolineaceae bacterium]|nr:amidase [Anaerolineaceae bacterium]
MSSYELKTLKLPRMTGNTLAVFANLIETKIGKLILLDSLLENGGMPKLRSKNVNDPPTFYPSVKPSGEELYSEGFQELIEKDWNIPFPTAFDYEKSYQAQTSSPISIAEQVWRNFKITNQIDSPMNIFIAMNRDDLMRQAEEATQRLKEGRRLSPIDGVPVAIKDEIDQLPYPTTVGTSFLGKQPAKQDSTVVARLRTAGALLVGKTNMHEIGIAPNGANIHYGSVRNPYDLTCDSGGSSSGSAAAVASGIVPAAIGADGGGSMRIPATLCGVVALKPTFGRVSEFGAAPLDWSVAHLGPITASVYDTALVYSIIAGPDEKDPNSLVQPPVTVQGWNTPNVDGLRFGIYPDWNEHADPEIVLAFKEMLSKLEKRGAEIVEIDIPELDEFRIAHAVTILSEMALSMRAYKTMRKEMGESVRLSLVLGEVMTSSDYIQSQRFRTRALNTFSEIFKTVEVILSPGTAKTAQPIPVSIPTHGWSDLSTDTEYMRYVFPANLTGLPAISFPCGYDERGIPIGMQAMSKHWNEHILLRVAYNAEQELDRRLPGNFYPSLI